MVIVLRLVSATRRPTEHRAHHDRGGRPRRRAHDALPSGSERQPVIPHGLPVV